jgi:hypothetical protein
VSIAGAHERFGEEEDLLGLFGGYLGSNPLGKRIRGFRRPFSQSSLRHLLKELLIG